MATDFQVAVTVRYNAEMADDWDVQTLGAYEPITAESLTVGGWFGELTDAFERLGYSADVTGKGLTLASVQSSYTPNRWTDKGGAEACARALAEDINEYAWTDSDGPIY